MKVDTVIVGAGTAGLSALREVRRFTEDVLLVNDGHWGTTCAAVGCMPSKALIEAANGFHRRHDFDRFGIRGSGALSADIPAVLARVRALRDDFVKGPEAVPGKLGDRALAGRARLAGPGAIEVDGRRIEARAIILAPGSRPIVPAPWRGFGDRILTSDTLFEQPDLPRRIAVIGLGAIGVELAQALARLGLKVAGFDAAGTLAGIDDANVLAALHPLIAAEFPVHLGAEATLEDAGSAIRVIAGDATFDADAVIAAIGRRPNLEGLGLETLGVPLDDHGMPPLDPETLRIGDTCVFLAGDANGKRPLLHEALDEGFLAGRNATAREPHDSCRRIPLRIVFSEPQIAVVGRSFADLAQEKFIAGSVDFENQSRAIIAGVNDGLLKVYVDPQSARILGSEMAVPAAEHLAHLLALCIQREMTVFDLLRMPFYHPTVEEGLRSALRDAARRVSQPQTEAGTAYCEICPEPPLR